jgi:Mn-dependent DtxR family transcriptional regulator
MQRHRSEARSVGVARPGTQAHEHQRRLILELAIEPPEAGEHPEDLARVLDLSPVAVESAAKALIAAGLVERRGGRLFPSAATRAIEELWPLAL